MARYPDAPPAKSAATRAAGPTGTSRSPSWMPRPRGGPSSRYQLPAACVWAEEVDSEDKVGGDREGCHPDGTERGPGARRGAGTGPQGHGGHSYTHNTGRVWRLPARLPVPCFLFKKVEKLWGQNQKTGEGGGVTRGAVWIQFKE